ncbi:MAG: hypothetical protein HYV40_05030 [Candidatus Levybacteria bacterium]|nr:hypothetical protein [Candidatus Levybacteria bacterium]
MALAEIHDGQHSPQEYSHANHLLPSLREHFRYYFGNLELSTSASEYYPGLENSKPIIQHRAEQAATIIIERVNTVAEILNDPEFTILTNEQKKMIGPCVLGIAKCIDGRLNAAQLFGMTANVWETMAGIIPTIPSPFDGERILLYPQTLSQAIAARPKQDDHPELLEINIAHTECGAMDKRKTEQERKGEPFASDDLVAENLKLFVAQSKAITNLYNLAAAEADHDMLQRVTIDAVYDTDSMGFIFGYGQDAPLFTPRLTRDVAQPLSERLLERYQDMHYVPGMYRFNFHQTEVFLEKERVITNIIKTLLFDLDYNHGISNQFRKRMFTDLHRIPEVTELSANQYRALEFFIARNVALQYTTGLYEHQAGQEAHHAFADHAEAYQSITRDDGLNVTVGLYDPEVQVFGASAPKTEDAVDHILTQSWLMNKRDLVKVPYILFVTSALAEDATDEDSIKQARANVAKIFRDIVTNEQMLAQMRAGVFVVVPAIVKNRSHEIIEIPNLALSTM